LGYRQRIRDGGRTRNPSRRKSSRTENDLIADEVLEEGIRNALALLGAEHYS
jgi:hypothetical protein